MELSNRLRAAADLVSAGSRIADIGTDHAYLPIYLVERQRVVSAIALDVNEGPLKRAKAHIHACGMAEKIELRLSDGMQKLSAFEVDTAVLTGMGGGLMIRILKAYPEVTSSLTECVLQPQSEIAKVRTFLLEEGFLFLAEDMVKEDGKYYPMMKVAPPVRTAGEESVGRPPEDFEKAAGKRRGEGTEKKVGERQEEGTEKKAGERRGEGTEKKTGRGTETDSERIAGWGMAERRYGKLLLEGRHLVLKEYLEKEYKTKKQILSEIAGNAGERILKRRAELEQELEWIRKGLEYYAM